jgi:hypothetical protein
MHRHAAAARLVTAAGLVIAAAVTVPALASSPDLPSQLVSPHAHGPVDLGDRVAYRLRGPACQGEVVRAVVTAAGQRIAGRESTAQPDPRASRSSICGGIVTIPDEGQVRSAGWHPGEALAIDVVAPDSDVTLQYSRVEVDLGRPVAGSPTRVISHDPRSGPRDKAWQLSTGDVVEIPQVDLTKIYSLSFRVCLDLPKPHVPEEITLRAGNPDCPAVLGPIDVADDMLNDWKSIDGWPDCWQLQPWPITGEVPGRAPRLFLEATLAPEPLLISAIDFNGTGAKVVDRPPHDPAGTKQIFDGTSFKGWDHSGCARTDHAVRTANHASGCSMTYTGGKVHNVMLRLGYRQQDFAANGGIYLGSEIQMREPGEWLTGGYLGDQFTPALVGWAVDPPVTGYPAQRIKTNSYPDWSQIEIVQLGKHYRVTINGHVVTDYLAPSDPEPYDLQLVTQPEFSFHYGASGRFDAPYPPVVTTPSSWGNIWYKNVRLYQCKGLHDRVCT